jgi:hypothetical protein
VIRPDALPVVEACSRAALAPPDVAALFGKGYRLRGTERVRVVAAGRAEVSLPAEASAASALWLDALDRDALGPLPLRLAGPAGSLPAPAPLPLARRLVLPGPVLRAWGLEEGGRATVEVGGLALPVTGAGAGVHLCRAARALAGEGPARLRRDLDLGRPPEAEPSAPGLRPAGRLITETDVRQARLRGQRIEVGAGQLLTPAARSLGRELGVLVYTGAQPSETRSPRR